MSKLTCWAPSRDLLGVHDEVNRLFDRFVNGTALRRGDGGSSIWTPAVDIRETDDNFFVRIDLPGVDKKDIKVSVYGDTLTVRGERHEESDQKNVNWHRVERYHGAFERQFQLGAAVQGDKVGAAYKDGVLEIRIPKAETAKPREIPIQVAGS